MTADRVKLLEAVADAAAKLMQCYGPAMRSDSALGKTEAAVAALAAHDAQPAVVAGEAVRGVAAYQIGVHAWTLACFGSVIAADETERCHRFVEEALELSQSCGGTRDDAHKLVDYVYGRDIGERAQEVGGVMVTLAALCSAFNIDLDNAAAVELGRCWQNIERIRAKQAAKPIRSPLPIPATVEPGA